jgi:hypothetical protein
MNRKQQLISGGRHWHRLLVWPALLAIIVFVTSAFMHLLLTWTGPQTAINKPPQQVFASTDVNAIPSILREHHIARADIVKLVPSAQEPLLQITENALSPRRYFSLRTGKEIPGQDEQQARWLANYYLNDTSRAIQSITFQTAFDHDYPWVNRLLPVYKIVYEGDEGLTLYIHTEIQALASISNHWKRNVQTIFRQLHTFAWLEDYRHGRVILMMIFLSSLLAMILAGFSLLYLLSRHGAQKKDRRAHRVLAHVIGVPLLGFTASGIYHLLHSEYANVSRDFNLSQPLRLESNVSANLPLDVLSGQSLHSISLITVGGQLFYRASVAGEAPAAAGEHDHHQVRQQRFDGIPKEQGGIYIPLGHSADIAMRDEQVARRLVMDHIKISDSEIISAVKVTRFGPEYDFRNKRLPVWRVAINNAARDILFVDVASGLLVDRVNRASRMEGYSFSFLHKWNFLSFPLGREKRDALIALVLLGALVLAGLGVKLRTSTASRR